MSTLPGAPDDRFAVGEVVVGYARSIDAFDFDGIAALFTEDCTASYGTIRCSA